MKYKVINQNENDCSIVDVVLKNRGIEDINDYLNTPQKYEIHYSNLNNIEKVAERLNLAFQNGDSIGLLVDCDVDGNTSSAIIYRYIKMLNPIVDITLFFHEGKQHGLSYDVIDEIRESGLDLLFIVDAASNDYEQVDEISKLMDIIILDHHETDRDMDNAILVNNQLSDRYENKQLSGAGVVYRVCQSLDDFFGENIADHLIDLCALGNIADGMDLRNLDTRYVVQEGLSKINNTLIKAIYYKQTHSKKPVVNITSVGWTVAPILNAVIRVGTKEEKKMMFEGLISNNREFCDEVVKTCLKAHRRQTSIVKKLVPALQDMIVEQGLENNKAIILDTTGMGDREVMGLVANKLTSIYRRPIMLLQEVTTDTNVLSGSVRSPREVDGFRSLCIDTGEFEFCEGHQNAFGCKIRKENVDRATIKINDRLKDMEISESSTHMVDAVIPYSRLKAKDVYAIGKLADLWGNGIDEPLFVIKNIKLLSNDIRLAGKNNTIIFSKDEFGFIKYFTNKATWERMTMKDGFVPDNNNITLDIVCKFKINEWMGNVKPQLEILDFNVTKDELHFF